MRNECCENNGPFSNTQFGDGDEWTCPMCGTMFLLVEGDGWQPLVMCQACSEAGGASRPIYHTAPECV